MTESGTGGGLEPRQYRLGQTYLGKVPKGADLAAYLDGFLADKGIRAGAVGVIGILERARLGFYDTGAGKYVVTEVPNHCEIASCLGNISLRDGRAGVHAHIVVSDAEGRTLGGHLLEGCAVHYAEFWILAFEGQPFERGLDPVTNVMGWVR